MTRNIASALIALSLVLATSLGAQVSLDLDPGGSMRTRADLERLLELYQEILDSPAYSDVLKEATRDRAERIRERLAVGDFRLGDRVVLSVEGEETLPDTLLVRAGQIITLPVFGDISLVGVLRSEVADHIAEALREYIHEPVVRAEGLMRISIQGQVRSPGFYMVPGDMLLGEVLMVAGGPGSESNLDGMLVERGVEVLLEGEEALEAVRQGFTLDQLNLQAGDQIVLPEQPTGILTNLGMIMGAVGSIIFLISRLGGL